MNSPRSHNQLGAEIPVKVPGGSRRGIRERDLRMHDRITVLVCGSRGMV